MLYVTWEYYSSLYDTVAEGDFQRLCMKASAKLDVYTHLRTQGFEDSYEPESATPFETQVHIQIQNTTCELINLMSVQDTAGVGTGISSVSNDGYSESYKVTTQAEKEVELVSLIRQGLSGTGLAGAL